jgi:PKHD-type hydroxylase
MRNTWQMWSGGVTSNTLDIVRKEAASVPFQEATIFADAKKNSKIRRSNIKWLTHNNVIRGVLWSYIQEANRNAFGFDVTNVGDIQYTEYDESEKGHYDWHHDIHWSQDKAYDRKLSITIQLSDTSDYEGGNFEFCEVPNPDLDASKKLGTVLVFPSYLQHKVAPVTKGKRISLVGWFEGPRWK